MLQSCSSIDTHLTGDYYIFAPGELNDTYTLGVKVGCKNDVDIDSIVWVKWNDCVIAVQRLAGDKRWGVVKANDKKLKSCNNDTVFYPLSENEFNLIMMDYADVEFYEKYF